MSKPSAQGVDPTVGFLLYVLHFNLSSSSSFSQFSFSVWMELLLSLKIGFLLGWLHNKGTFSGPLILRERCERSQQTIDGFTVYSTFLQITYKWSSCRYLPIVSLVLWWYRVVNTVIEKKGNLGTFLEIFQTEKQPRKGLWNVWQFSTVGLYLQLMFWYIQHMSFFCRFLHPDLPQCCYLPNELINSFNDLIYNLII